MSAWNEKTPRIQPNSALQSQMCPESQSTGQGALASLPAQLQLLTMGSLAERQMEPLASSAGTVLCAHV